MLLSCLSQKSLHVPHCTPLICDNPWLLGKIFLQLNDKTLAVFLSLPSEEVWLTVSNENLFKYCWSSTLWGEVKKLNTPENQHVSPKSIFKMFRYIITTVTPIYIQRKPTQTGSEWHVLTCRCHIPSKLVSLLFPPLQPEAQIVLGLQSGWHSDLWSFSILPYSTFSVRRYIRKLVLRLRHGPEKFCPVIEQ